MKVTVLVSGPFNSIFPFVSGFQWADEIVRMMYCPFNMG